jgi:hypothetical protein
MQLVPEATMLAIILDLVEEHGMLYDQLINIRVGKTKLFKGCLLICFQFSLKIAFNSI